MSGSPRETSSSRRDTPARRSTNATGRWSKARKSSSPSGSDTTLPAPATRSIAPRDAARPNGALSGSSRPGPPARPRRRRWACEAAMSDSPRDFSPSEAVDDGVLPEDLADDTGIDDEYALPTQDQAGPPNPVNWHLLSADALEAEWFELNRWVETLRRTYGLPASVIPPFWHRHDELLWELSALHLHWLCAYDPEQDGSAPFGWHRDFADARNRLRDWVASSGTRLDRDRPTRQTSWPGEDPADPVEDVFVADRDQDFVDYVAERVTARREAEEEFYRAIASEDRP